MLARFAVASCWLLLVTPLVRAEDASTTATPIVWQTVAGCPHADHAQKLAAELGAQIRVASTADHVVQLTRLADRRFAATITRPAEPAAARRLEDADCTRLARAALLVVAIASDPLALARRLATRPQDAAAPTRPLQTALGLQATLDDGSLPRPSAGLGVELAFQLAHGSLEAGALAFLPSVETSSSGSGVKVGLYSGLLRGCAALPVWALRVSPCAALELGRVSGQGVGVKAPREAHGLWSAAWLGLHVQPRAAGRFSPGIRLEVGTPIERPSFEVAGEGRLFRASRLLVRAAMTIRYEIF